MRGCLRWWCLGNLKISQIFCVCFIVFLYMSADCVSTIRTCVQIYLEWLPFIFCFLPSFDFLSIWKVIIFSTIVLESSTFSCWTKKFGVLDCFIVGRGLRKFLAASSTKWCRYYWRNWILYSRSQQDLVQE